jgi:urease
MSEFMTTPSLQFVLSLKDQWVFVFAADDLNASHEGNTTNALYLSFLPVPPNSTFPPLENGDEAHSSVNAPGALRLKKEDIIEGAKRERVKATNKGDRPVQVRVAFPLRRVVF